MYEDNKIQFIVNPTEDPNMWFPFRSTVHSVTLTEWPRTLGEIVRWVDQNLFGTSMILMGTYTKYPKCRFIVPSLEEMLSGKSSIKVVDVEYHRYHRHYTTKEYSARDEIIRYFLLMNMIKTPYQYHGEIVSGLPNPVIVEEESFIRNVVNTRAITCKLYKPIVPGMDNIFRLEYDAKLMIESSVDRLTGSYDRFRRNFYFMDETYAIYYFQRLLMLDLDKLVDKLSNREDNIKYDFMMDTSGLKTPKMRIVRGSRVIRPNQIYGFIRDLHCQ